MVLNGLGFVNPRLYRIPHFLQDKPTERLLGAGIGPEHLNDDVTGRAWDRLYEQDVTSVYALVSMEAVKRVGLRPRCGHLDTYAQLPLQRVWGSGKSASADGTQWEMTTQNLMSEYHIRYGGYGGIGYYLVADSYIALFSRFSTCGAWEGHYILDFIDENQSDIQPDTLHADSQGQSTAIFGLAYLLGIQLMPRIRHWKNLNLCRPHGDPRYTHIDALFGDHVDWDRIETMLPDMLRVALSI